MKKLILLFTIINLQLSINNSYAQELDWAIGMGSTEQDVGLDVAVGINYSVYTVGTFRGTVDFDPGPNTYNLTGISNNSAIFIQGVTQGGGFMWANKIAGSDDMQAFSIATDAAGNVYTTGNFSGVTDFDPTNTTLTITPVGGKDCFIIKYDPNGALQWVKTFGGDNDDVPRSIYVDADGNSYTCGTFTGTVDFNPGSGTYELTNEGLLSGYVQKLDANGDFVWAIMNTRVGSAMQSYSIETDNAGNVYIGGAFSGNMNFNHAGTPYYIDAVVGYNAYIQKLDSDGNFIWAKGADGSSTGNSLSIDHNNNVYLTGYFFNTVDFDPGNANVSLTSAGSNDSFVWSLDSAGNFRWAKRMGGTQTEIGQSIRSHYAYIYSAGRFEGSVDFNPNGSSDNFTSAGNTDIYIQQLDTSGNYIQTLTFGAANADEAYGLFVDDMENIYTTGRYNATVDFDPGPGTTNLVASTGTTGDVFVQKLTYIIISAEDKTFNEFSIYPNPATTTISILPIAIGTMVNSPWAVVNIYNAQGALVMQATLNIQTLNIEHLSPGLYYLHLQSAEGVGVKKFEVIK